MTRARPHHPQYFGSFYLLYVRTPRGFGSSEGDRSKEKCSKGEASESLLDYYQNKHSITREIGDGPSTFRDGGRC